MATERLTISLEAELAAEVRAAAAQGAASVSAWLADAARTQLTIGGLPEVIEAWEREHGVFTSDELAQASRRLGR